MDQILTVKEVAKYLKIDPQTASRKAQRGEIPGFKIGNRWRFKSGEIDRWLEAQVHGAQKRNPGDPIGDVRSYLKSRPEVRLVYLFGSMARGDAGETSDLDLAFLFDEGLNRLEQGRILSEIGKKLDAQNADLVSLNHAPPLLKYEVVSDGRLVYKTIADEEVASFELGVYREYFHTERQRRLQYEALAGA